MLTSCHKNILVKYLRILYSIEKLNKKENVNMLTRDNVIMLTLKQGQGMIRLLSILGVIAALILVAASAFMNFQYVTGWGKDDLNGQIFGAISIALDVTKALLPFFILWAWKNNRFIHVALGSFLFTCLVTFSLLSALGFAASNRAHTTGKKQTITTEFQEIESDLKEAISKRDAQPQARAVAVIAQAIKAKELSRRFTSSKGCTNVTAKKSRAFCSDLFALKEEKAAATEKAKYESQITALKARRGNLRQQGAGQQADPQAGLLAKLTGLKIADTQTALTVFIAVLVEMAAAFGLYLSTAHGGFDASQQNKIRKPRKVSNDNKKARQAIRLEKSGKKLAMMLA